MEKIIKILITRPEHDPLTYCLSRWNNKIIVQAQNKGCDIFDLCREKANKKEFEGRMNKNNPDLILLNGHGNENSITGHDNQILVKNGENHNLLKNRITYAVACAAAKKLGVVCADEKTTFIGYDHDFILNLDSRFLGRPLNDKRAQRFLDSSNKITEALLKGHTCQEASEISKQAFKNNIKILLKDVKNQDDLEDIKDLFWNMSHQVCLGNLAAKI